MVGRVFLLLVGGILASASLTLFLAERDRQEFVIHMRTLYAAERIEQLVLMLDTLPAAARAVEPEDQLPRLHEALARQRRRRECPPA